ncbi:hypothetical protein PoB_006729800 [Plakobranchus ocellatus]|uniref:Uncharacterized protein n=1 Tax=Plakobranchus ocellatus TaxID=259542 RepID=A0AAV4D9R0_9GAST|nr:hypothetical protein PoB_006729800 [Plakobranchus ocellatus]
MTRYRIAYVTDFTIEALRHMSNDNKLVLTNASTTDKQIKRRFIQDILKYINNRLNDENKFLRMHQDSSIHVLTRQTAQRCWVSNGTLKEDCFVYSGLPAPANLAITKRPLFRFIAYLFDPLGFLSPYVVTSKLLFQELWELGIEWDDELRDTLRDRFRKWLKDLDVLPEWKIPRSIAVSSLTGAERVKLHTFRDASEKAYVASGGKGSQSSLGHV